MTNDTLVNGNDDSILHVPTTMIWVCGRWTLIFHTDMDFHDPAEVRTNFLNVLPLLDFSIYYANCHNFPLFSLEQDGTFQPMITDFQYIPPNHLLVQIPGRQHSWFVEIPSSPLRPLTSSYLRNPSILNASVPDDNINSVDLSNVLDPQLLEGGHGQLALPPADVSNASSACFTPWGAAQESLGDNSSMAEHCKADLVPYCPTDNLMGQQSIEMPQCPPSTPVRPGSPETVYSDISPPNDVSLEQCTEKPRRTRSCPCVGSCRAGRRLRRSCVSKKCTKPRKSAKGHFKVSQEDRLMVPFDKDLRDELLILGRAMGFSYSEIKEKAGMPDALTTLRGRYGSLLRKMALQQELMKKKKRENKKDSDGRNKE